MFGHRQIKRKRKIKIFLKLLLTDIPKKHNIHLLQILLLSLFFFLLLISLVSSIVTISVLDHLFRILDEQTFEGNMQKYIKTHQKKTPDFNFLKFFSFSLVHNFPSVTI